MVETSGLTVSNLAHLTRLCARKRRSSLTKKTTMLIMTAVTFAPATVLAQIADAIAVVQPGPAIIEKATAPQPPANATKVTQAGKGKAGIRGTWGRVGRVGCSGAGCG
jgi:hypothetical protein